MINSEEKIASSGKIVRSPGWAVGERDLASDVSDVNDSAFSRMLCSINDKLESDFDFVGDVLAAVLVLAQAERTALLGALGARAPADRSDTVSFMLARFVAEGSALFLILVAGQRRASCAAVRFFRA